MVITNRYVYKVKKAVNLGFLDFSTLEKRRHFCEREVLLNRRLSLHVHLGVLPIFANKGQLAFSVMGAVAEYAIQMRKLDPRYFLPRLLRLNKVRPRAGEPNCLCTGKILPGTNSDGRDHPMGKHREVEDQHRRKLSTDRKVYRQLDLTACL